MKLFCRFLRYHLLPLLVFHFLAASLLPTAESSGYEWKWQRGIQKPSLLLNALPEVSMKVGTFTRSRKKDEKEKNGYKRDIQKKVSQQSATKQQQSITFLKSSFRKIFKSIKRLASSLVDVTKDVITDPGIITAVLIFAVEQLSKHPQMIVGQVALGIKQILQVATGWPGVAFTLFLIEKLDKKDDDDDTVVTSNKFWSSYCIWFFRCLWCTRHVFFESMISGFFGIWLVHALINSLKRQLLPGSK